DPVRACMASQYAGWQVSVGKFFAMGSGPMRAAYGKEALFDHIPGREKPPVAVGVLETRKLQTEEAIDLLAVRIDVTADTACWLGVGQVWRGQFRWLPARWRQPFTSCMN